MQRVMSNVFLTAENYAAICRLFRGMQRFAQGRPSVRKERQSLQCFKSRSHTYSTNLYIRPGNVDAFVHKFTRVMEFKGSADSRTNPDDICSPITRQYVVFGMSFAVGLQQRHVDTILSDNNWLGVQFGT